MTTVIAQREIAAPADAVWAALDDFGGISRMHPAVVRSYLTGERASGVGAERRCDFDDSGDRHIYERIVGYDPDARTLRISAFAGTFRPPVRDVEAIMQVEDLGGDRSRLTMRMDLDGNVLQRAMAATVVRRKLAPMLDAVLAGTDVHVTTGREVRDFDDLAPRAAA